MTGYHIADNRAVLRVSGADRIEFLQGIVSNDVTRVSESSAVWAALLTPQGKYLHDFFLIASGDCILIDAEAERAADLHKRLRRHTLRSDASVEIARDLIVAITTGTALSQKDGVATFTDPRHPDAGGRAIGKSTAVQAAAEAAGIRKEVPETWDVHRLSLGLPDGARDFELGRSTLAEGNADFLGAIDWQKGCWMGQEVTARIQYRGLAKRRLVPMRFDGPAPNHSNPVNRDGKDIGEIRSVTGNMAMVLAKIEVIDVAADAFQSGDTTLTAAPPEWLLSALSGEAVSAGSA